MSAISHHISDSMLAAYAAGNVPLPFSAVIASHISLCITCRATLEAHQMLGGAVLETVDEVAVSGTLKSDILSQLDAPFMPKPVFQRSGVFPGPVMQTLKGRAPRWKSLGMGIQQDILMECNEGSLRLLSIPPGQAVPDHSHRGLELTLVLQGSFSDQTGRFGVGDIEIADEAIEHTPTADEGPTCICLAATDASLRFRNFLPRLLQPLFRI